MKSIGCVKYDFIKSKRVIIKTIEINCISVTVCCVGGGKRKIVEKNGRGDLTKNSTYKEKINWNKA